ncbi:MAG: HNH endonuclease [Gammaproteobacteria bacterium]|nr:HNH endonuclease [Gammaproteobacteria bacterium]
MFDFQQPVLRTDISGMPLEWIDYKRAVTLITLDQVAYTCGDFELSIAGGHNRITGEKSIVEINSIIATQGHFRSTSGDGFHYSPPLHNLPLFQRDGYLCLYCGDKFHYRDLSRDHVTPFSQGGQDIWTNVVTACVRCNNHKAGRTPEQAGMTLLAIPFTPTRAEYIYLQGRRILADQMEFLKSHFPRTSPLHDRT